MAPTVAIGVGEPGSDFVNRYPGIVRIQHQPTGIDFYSIDWDRPPRAVVRVEHGANTFEISNSFGVQAMQDTEEMKSEGLSQVTVYAGVSDPGLISHDEARLQTFKILRQVLNAGWQQVIEPDGPRLKGKFRLDYMLATTNSNGLDASYVPTFEEWMSIPSRTPWSFYANGVYMDIVFTREPTLTDPTKPGSYLLTFNMKSEVEHLRGYAGPDHRLNWKPFVQPELGKAAEVRAQKEGELRARGIPIDEFYRDPPLPRLK